MATAVYPGSFDPVTRGHLDIIKRAAKINDHLIVAVLINSAKHPLFTVEERVALLQECCKGIPNVTVESFDGLTVEFAKKRHASVMVRGLRAVTDFENEIQLAQTNHALMPGIETMFLATSIKWSYLSSTIVKEAARYGSSISKFVTPNVEAAGERTSDPHSLCKKRFGVLIKQSFLNHNIHNQEAIHMKKIVIASACRTAIGKFGGTLANVPAAELGSIVIKEALNRANVKPEQVDHVYMGCVIQAGLGQNVARQASLKAGLPIETPAVTVNVVCGSGLNCVNMAAQMIEAGDADIVVAGGMENMDMAPFAMMKGRYGYRMGAPMGKSELVDTMVNDALWDATGFNKHMGMTAENVCTNETFQKKYGYSPITREMLDEFSYNSQVKADKAIKDGAFKDEIVPVVIKGKKGDTVFDTDEGPRLTPVEKLGTLKPAFTKDGIVTAGNSSAINDGAAALVIMSEEKAKELGVKPLATWVAGALAGVEPEVMGLGPIAATKKVMAKTGLTVADMDLIEANEAFAAQSVAVSQALNFDMSKVNVNGGAIALGHPVGASGARILVTLLYAMKHRGAHKGLATLCIGGGMGCATIVEM